MIKNLKQVLLWSFFVLFILFSIGLFGITMFILGTSVGDNNQEQQKDTPSKADNEVIILQQEKKVESTSLGNLTPTDTMRSLVIKSDKNLDGYRSTDRSGNETQEIRVGRNTEAVTRGFVSFPLNRIPARSTIKKATLRLYQTQVEGDPITSMGGLYIDHLFYGNILDDTDYALPAIVSSAFELKRSRNVGWKEVEVTAAVLDDYLLGRGVSQYRIHFENETRSKNGADYVFFESGETRSGITNAPELFIEYTR